MVVSGYLLMACLFTCTCINVLKSPQRSSSCLVAHKASKESFHFSRLAVVVFTSSHDCHPASALSFSTVLPRVVFGTHDVYVSTGHFSRYLRNVTISVQCMYIPVADLPDILGVYRLPIQLGGVLLPLAPTHHEIALL